jgi:membrane protease YdiL (CAAX protease family)
VSALDPRAERSDRPLLAFVVVGAGTVALLSRPFVDAGPNTRIGLLAAAYIAIGLACVAVPVERGRARLPAAVVVTMGLSAVSAVALSAGPGVPVSWGSWALPLSVLAAVGEEALFRRVAYARLERFGAAAAIVVTAGLFALVHLPAYGLAAIPVDLCAGVLFGWQRWASGNWTAPAATHAAANLWVVLG